MASQKTRENNPKIEDDDNKSHNLCKYQPKAMIKYINMQTNLCPCCKANNIIIRCSQEHLENHHNYKIATVHEIIEQVMALTKELRSKKNKKNKKIMNIILQRGLIWSSIPRNLFSQI